ncbi:MAG: hypothetical protein CGU28_05415 [Candidatus Dactylopiibacterium carminicum]|nr:MAG: hypothetical protein CGU28_05415 [Candidatus Dactylopiibacterium carminicum]
MSLATRIESLVIRVAQEFNDVRNKAGNLASLSTTDKSSLVAAINELTSRERTTFCESREAPAWCCWSVPACGPVRGGRTDGGRTVARGRCWGAFSVPQGPRRPRLNRLARYRGCACASGCVPRHAATAPRAP